MANQVLRHKLRTRKLNRFLTCWMIKNDQQIKLDLKSETMNLKLIPHFTTYGLEIFFVKVVMEKRSIS